MQPVHTDETDEDGSSAISWSPDFVSGRFVSDLLTGLDRCDVPTTRLIGDLPIEIGATGRVTHSVEWSVFSDFMNRLEMHAGSPEALESLGEQVGALKPSRMLTSLAGFSTSPYSLYRAATRWALHRALPGVEMSVEQVEPNLLEVRARLADGLRPCAPLFHMATGAARTLPRVLGMCDAVVRAEVGDFETRLQITLPPSRTIWARLTRTFRSIFFAGSVLQFLETQQLELHAKHAVLQKTNAALAESERRYRAITDAAVDVLCEIDENGRIVYVSASVEDLMGYTPEQVTGSHFSLWIPTKNRDCARDRFAELASQSIERAVSRERVRLHTESGDLIAVEISLRAYRTPEGDVRMVGILRDETHRSKRRTGTRSGPGTTPGISSLEPLRSRIKELRHSDPARPIERSLSILLAALEAGSAARDEAATSRLVGATDRMARIVEGAMALVPDPSAEDRWIETKKLMERVRLEFLAREDPAPDRSSRPALRIDTTDATPLVLGEESLLTTALGSLLDWAAGRATAERDEPETDSASPAIELFLASTAEVVDGRTAIVFAVGGIGAPAPTARGGPTGQPPTEAAEDPLADELALAIAEDAVAALGGELRLSNVRQQPVARLRLPQPDLPRPTLPGLAGGTN
ncbi:MAG TPA: PAS domain S-box protein [Deltaproteobacteria bacterium]|nr:PAS domain S-box protein [Deltaproteobacteria bacterium]